MHAHEERREKVENHGVLPGTTSKSGGGVQCSASAEERAIAVCSLVLQETGRSYNNGLTVVLLVGVETFNSTPEGRHGRIPCPGSHMR